jgi:hypothetical protein
MSPVPIPIRLQCSTVSATAPIDANTGSAPIAWRGQALAVQVGIFDNNGVAIDVSGLASLSVALQATADALTPLAVVTTTNFTAGLTKSDWLAGLAQQAECDFTSAQTDQSLGGAAYANLWVVVTGITSAGATIIYGAGMFVLMLASNSVPFPAPAGLVSYHAQGSATGNSTVTPTSQLHTEVLTISGAARTSNVVLGVTNISAGARLALRLTGLNSASAIVLNFLSGSLSGPNVVTLTTNGTMVRAWIDATFDGSQWNFALVTTSNT